MNDKQYRKFQALTSFMLKLLPGRHWKLPLSLIIGFIELTILILVPLIGARIINALKAGDWESFKQNVILLALLTLVQMGVGLVSRYIYIRLNERVGQEMRQLMVHKILLKKYRFFERFWVGDIVSRTINDSTALKGYITEVFLQIIYDLVTLILVVAILLWMNPTLALITIVVAPATLIYGRLFQPKLESITLQVRSNIAALTGYLQSWLSRPFALKIYTLEKEATNQFTHRNDELMASSIRSGTLGTVISAVNMTLLSIPSLVIFAYGGYLSLHGKLSIGELFAFMTFSTYFNAPIQRLIGLLVTRLPTLYPIHQRIQEIIEQEDGMEVLFEIPRASIVGISVRDVEFGFEDEERFKLLVPRFSARRGEIVGITGSNGSGKSTFARLLMGLYESEQGDIRIEGENRQALLVPDRRRLFACMPQELVLFDGSLVENMTLFDRVPDLNRLLNIAEELSLISWIESLPGAWETEINAGLAKTLSGGQMQKVGLARLLYRDSPILLLDEPGSALDSSTLPTIHKILTRARADRIVIIITHSIELLPLCDRVYRLRPVDPQSETYECLEEKSESCNLRTLQLDP